MTEAIHQHFRVEYMQLILICPTHHKPCSYIWTEVEQNIEFPFSTLIVGDQYRLATNECVYSQLQFTLACHVKWNLFAAHPVHHRASIDIS